MTTPSLKDVIERHRHRIMQIKGVNGVGAGLSPSDHTTHCILVYAATDHWPDELEHEIEGYKVEIVKSKGFRAL
jgi:hypothetical protein